MCADRNLSGPSTRTRKMSVIPHKIGKLKKNKIHRKLKLNKEIKKCMKKKEIQEEILRSPTLCSKTNIKINLKNLKKDSTKKIESNIKRRRLRLNTLIDEKLNVKAKNILVEFKSDEKEKITNCLRSRQYDEVPSEQEYYDSQSVSVDKNISDPKPYDERANQSEKYSPAEVNDTDEDDSSVHSDENSSSETVCQRNRDFSNSSQIFKGSSPKDAISDVSSKKIHEAKAEFHHISGKSYLLILRHPGQIYFRGTLSVTPVSGITSFLGYEFVPGMKSHLVFSPKGVSPLYLSTTGHTCDVEEIPKIPSLDENILNRLGDKDSSLLIEPASGEHWDKLFGLFKNLLKFNPLAPPLRDIGTMKTSMDVENDLGVELLHPSNSVSSKSFHRENLEWENLSKKIQCFNHQKGQVRAMVFGGKGVGKSTFMRFLVNRWLTDCNANRKECVSHKNSALLFIDFDAGQSEFVPPGCLSATLISEPLLGPNYTHLKDPERMICVGDIDISKCPKWYLDCADDLIKFCSSKETLNKLPWFINTMGFCKGIGADLAVELIRLCNPTHVIQLTSIWSRRNFEPLNHLSWPSVNSWKGQEWNSELSNQNEANVPEYSYHQLASLAEKSANDGVPRKVEGVEDIDSQWGLPAWQSRELCVLAYFSRIVTEPKFSVLKPKPYMFKLSDVVLSLPSDLVKPQFITSVFNGRLAALCNLENRSKINISSEVNKSCEPKEVNQESTQRQIGEQQIAKKPWETFLIPNVASHPKILFHMPLAPCLGFGIVRGIDNCNHEIYVTSPLNNDTMASVDCLATSPTIGSIPKPIIFNSVKELNAKSAPYVMIKDGRNKLSRTAPRLFQPFLAGTSTK